MNDWIAFETIIRKEITRFLRIWQQTLLPSVITMALYLAIFGTFLGSRIDDMQGFSYIQFIVPGLIMMSVITNAYTNVVSSFFSSKFVRSVEELLISPTSNFVIIMGYVLGGVLRGLLVGLLVTIVALFFTKLVVHNLLVISMFILLTALLFSFAGMVNAIFARKFDDVNIIPTFVLTPLIYLGGVFYSIQLLSGPWQILSKFNPILYMVNGFRFGFLGISDIDVFLALAMIFLFTLVLFGVCLYLFKKGIGLRH
ncbi:MAG TPA: ABC transporter permease [Candidatus Nanoarchaeia archaeon]|nr:ABC transporter permease [Candidatus Nanoarchaeia archaeon]